MSGSRIVEIASINAGGANEETLNKQEFPDYANDRKRKGKRERERERKREKEKERVSR